MKTLHFLKTLLFCGPVFLLSTNATAQDFSTSETNGSSGSCSGCNVESPSLAVGDDESDFSILHLTTSTPGAYVFQNYQFSEPGYAGNVTRFMIEGSELETLDSAMIANMKFYTSNGGVTNLDTATAATVSIFQIGETTQYQVLFTPATDFDEVGLLLEAGIPGTLNEMRIYSVSHFVLLPVELISFEGNFIEHGVRLHWSVASMQNTDHFTIEKSTNNSNFEPIGTISSSIGGSTASYTYLDNSAVGTNFTYRLSETDQNGRTVELETIMLSKELNSNMFQPDIYPNPFIQSLKIGMENVEANEVKVNVWNLEGKLISSEVHSNSSGNTIDVKGIEDLLPGSYILEVASGNQSFKKKVLKLN